MQIPGANQRSGTLMKFTFPLATLCYVAGTDKRGTRTNQRTFRSGSNKYPRGEVCQRRLQRRLCFHLPPPFQRRRRRRWLKFMPDGTTPIPPARVAIPTPVAKFWLAFRARYTHENPPLNFSFRAIDDHHHHPDVSRFNSPLASALVAQPEGTFVLYLPGNVLFRIVSIEVAQGTKWFNASLVNQKIKLCKSSF